MKTIRTEIADGINLCHISTDKFKQAVLNVGFISKLNPETAALNALLVAVLTKNCARFPKMADFNKELDRLYAADISGSVKKFGEVHYSYITASALQNRYVPDGEDVVKETIDLVFETLFAPALVDGVFDADTVEKEKKNLIDAIKATQNNKDGYAVRRCAEIMCENEKYGTQELGTVEAVEAITPEALTERYRQVITSAKFEIYFAGEYDEAGLAELIKGQFARVRRNLSLDQPSTKVRKKTSGAVKEITERQQMTQAKLVMGFRLGLSLIDRNFAAMQLFVEVLGGSPGSKLFMNVREKLSLCYYCSPIVEPIKGVMFIASAIEPANFERAREEILLQLQKAKDGEITDEEFNNAKESLINGYQALNDSASGLIMWYARRGILGFVDSPELAAQAVSYLTKEQVTKAAADVTLDTVYFLTGEEGKDVE